MSTILTQEKSRVETALTGLRPARGKNEGAGGGPRGPPPAPSFFPRVTLQ